MGTGYSWFCLPFFVLLLLCVTHSSCSLPACLCLSEKRRKLRLFYGARVFFRVFFFTPLERDSHFTVASRLPPFDRITLKIALVLHIQASSMKLMVVPFLYMRVFHFFIEKRKRALRTDSFFSMILTFFFSILILIITSPAIHYSQNVFRGYSILVCTGVKVFFFFFFFLTPPLARDSPSRSPRACLRLTEKR